MTYCLGIKVQGGLVAVSDGRITSAAQLSATNKTVLLGDPSGRFLIMNSGLRGLRDKTIAYFKREMSRRRGERFTRMLDAVGMYAVCLRRVAGEDREALEKSGLAFNLHAIIAGQLAEDDQPAMYLVYPEGNWIEADERAPFLAIGASAYGRAILDRALSATSDVATAMRLAYLSFDAACLACSDVGFPLDMTCYGVTDRVWRRASFDEGALASQRQWWGRGLADLVQGLPDRPWAEGLRPVEDADARASEIPASLHRSAPPPRVDKRRRAALKGQRGRVLWFTGLPAAGKTTIATLVEERLAAGGRHTHLLDGDVLRQGLTRDLGFSVEDRAENVRRVAECARLFVEAGLIVLVAVISPFARERRMARGLVAPDEFVEIWVDTPLAVCEARDPKGLYRRARAGLIPDFTGVDQPFETPDDADIVLAAGERDAAALADEVIAELRARAVV